MKNAPLRSLFLLLGSGLAACSMGQVNVPFTTGFEGPEFVEGPLSDNNVWQDSASGYRVIPDSTQGLTAPTVVHSGAQAVRYLNVFNLAGSGRTANVQLAPTAEINASVWINVASTPLTAFGNTIDYASAASQYYGLVLSNGDERIRSTYVALNSEGLVAGGIGNVAATPPALGSIGASALNRWVLLSIQANSVTGSVTASVDGQNFTLPSIDLGLGSFTEIALLRNGTEGDRAYAFFDDLSVTGPVPEPASLSVLALGVAALRRRRK